MRLLWEEYRATEHHRTAIVPTRVRKPRDKAKVEAAVLVVERWILARLRNRKFFSLAELNRAIAALLEDLNSRVMRHIGESRRELFERLDKPALRALPETPYEYAEWRIARVGIDYHVEVQKHFYSVPYRLLRQRVEIRIAARSVEIFHKGKRVALHRRERRPNRHTTIAEHMPSRHRRYADWTHERVLREAEAAPTARPWPRSSFASASIPNTGPVSASSGSPRPMDQSAWRLPASAHWKSATAPTARSARSSRTASTGGPSRSPPPSSRPPATATSAAPDTTTDPTHRPDQQTQPTERTDMLTHPTLDQLNQLGLTAMAQALKAQGDDLAVRELSFEERLGLLLQSEAAYRETKRYQARLHHAKLRVRADLEDID